MATHCNACEEGMNKVPHFQEQEFHVGRVEAIVTQSTLFIPEDQVDEALDRINSSGFFDEMFDNLDDALEKVGFFADDWDDEDGDWVIWVNSFDGDFGLGENIKNFLGILAPCVNDGSFIDFVDEDHHATRFKVTGGNVVNIDGHVIVKFEDESQESEQFHSDSNMYEIML